jgi:hypothetical protein
MSTDPNDSIQSLVRIISASSRLIAMMHRHADAIDLNEEIGHMQANLDHVRAEVERP